MIDPQVLDLASLPWLPLNERSAFPRQPAIYFAIDSLGEVQYIGISKDPRQRWSQHHRYQQLQSAGEVRIAYLFVEDAALLKSIEDALIAWFRPPLNVVGVPSCTEKKTGKQFMLTGTASAAIDASMKTMFCRLAVLMAEKSPKLTQRQLSKDLGLGVATVGRLHNNNFDRVDKRTVEKLCNYFGCDLNDLFVLVNTNEDASNDH